MGREAICECRWGDRTGRVTALLEAGELIVRGEIGARVPMQTLQHVDARGDNLEFSVAGERVELTLGGAVAARWAAAIARPPPTLARKLGIAGATRLHVAGRIDDAALEAAVREPEVEHASFATADLAILRTDDRAELTRWAQAAAGDAHIPPTWIVYRKGRDAPLGEHAVREVMLAADFVDTKVAAVSERLTGLRFTKRRT